MDWKFQAIVNKQDETGNCKCEHSVSDKYSGDKNDCETVHWDRKISFDINNKSRYFSLFTYFT